MKQKQGNSAARFTEDQVARVLGGHDKQQQPEVHLAFDMLQGNLMGLEDAVSALVGRLQPVMHQTPDGVSAKSVAEDGRCHVSSRALSAAQQVRELTGVLRHVLDRLEV